VFFPARVTGLGAAGVFVAITAAESLIVITGILVFRRGRWKRLEV